MPRTLLKPQRAWKQQVGGQRHAADALCIPQRLRPARPAIRPSRPPPVPTPLVTAPSWSPAPPLICRFLGEPPTWGMVLARIAWT